MSKSAKKNVKASISWNRGGCQDLGSALRRLRVLCDLTQNEMADRLNVQQAAISKIEKGSDVHLSTIKKYVEALGASLRLDASFPINAPLALHMRDFFDVEYQSDDQLILPLVGDESFCSQRDIVLSVRPQYSQKIFEGIKTVELRRRFPVSAPSGTVAYIYSTSPVRAMVGAASIKNVLKLPVDQIWTKYRKKASIEKKAFDEYFQGLEFGYALVFEDVKAFSRPIPLSELREHFGFEPPQSFLYAKRDLRRALKDESAIISH